MKSVVYAPILITLFFEKGTVDMKINKQNTKMEFYIPTITFIWLVKSTKLLIKF
jgi:hypothetical protein